MRLRALDAADRRAYLREFRPRILTLRVRAGRVNLRWSLPAWALEAPLRFVLRPAPLLSRWLPALVRAVGTPAPGSRGVRAAPAPAGLDARPPWWNGSDELFSESQRDLLLLPDGAPLLNVAEGNASIVIEEVRRRRRTRGEP